MSYLSNTLLLRLQALTKLCFPDMAYESLENIKNMQQFNAFLRLCAANVGQLINKSRLGNDIGVDSKTIDSWLSVLQASYILFLLPHHYNNFRKRTRGLKSNPIAAY
ncbi:MAG: DUF4143 domain-containing protein [gamma proteobacterium symbiont of Taylorina sp.]|nr:DUF4143 domain-containing protein [gamma proteobacterium symbiont of Taylorina sp.]